MTPSGLSTVAVTHVDLAGINRLKLVPAGRLDRVAATGATVSLSVAMLLSVDDHPVSTEHFDAVVGDLRLLPDLDELAVVDGEAGLGWAPADLHTMAGEAFVGCTRSRLAATVATARDAGLELSLGVELEFILLIGGGPVGPAHTGPGYGVRPFLELERFHLDLMAAFDAAGVGVEQLHPEYGLGQIEVAFAPKDPVSAIDELVLAKLIVLRTARRHGLDASFAPVPLPGGAGNGLHLHFSARADGRNVFHDPDGNDGVSATGAQLITGVLDGLRGGLALLAGSTASFQRLHPDNWAGAYLCWGEGNREAAVRLVHGYRGAEDRQANVEVKCIDGSCNPYLAAVWVLASALHGVTTGAVPTPPVAKNPSALTEDERRAAGVGRFPGNLGDALDRLERDAAARTLLGDVLLDTYVAVRRRDWEVFHGLPDEVVVERTRWRW